MSGQELPRDGRTETDIDHAREFARKKQELESQGYETREETVNESGIDMIPQDYVGEIDTEWVPVSSYRSYAGNDDDSTYEVLYARKKPESGDVEALIQPNVEI